ncbi:MAG: HlyD family secretion protein [Thiohalomonadales bacterium]
MILVLTLLYVGLLLLAIKLKFIQATLFWKLSPIIWMLLLLVGLFIPMQFWAPGGYVRIAQPTVQIVPNVAGEVIRVVAQPNKAVQKDDVLFQIDPIPFKAITDRFKADLEIATIRVKQQQELKRKGVGRKADLDRAVAQMKSTQAQLDGALYNLDQTTVRAPGNGIITNSGTLQSGARVVAAPFQQTMTFIDEQRVVLAQIYQTYMRYVEPGQTAEIAFKMYPGKVFKATVQSIFPGSALGQFGPSGLLPAAMQEVHGPMFVRLLLDDNEVAKTLLAGSTGEVAIYTPRGSATHVIRKVMIRMTAIMNYVIPF